jgi:Cytochrome C'
MQRIRLMALSMLALAFALATDSAGARGGKDKPLLTDDQFTKFVQAEGKQLQEALAKGKLDKKLTRKAMASTMMLMAYAANSAYPDKASVGDNAAELYDALAGGDVDKAKSLAAMFYPKIEKRKDRLADGKLRGKCSQIMGFFASPIIGGLGAEKELGEAEEQKENLSPAQFERLTELGTKISAIAAVARLLPPDEAKGQQDWNQFADSFSKAALGLTSTAQAKNEAGTRQALEKLSKTCTQCHDKYRN